MQTKILKINPQKPEEDKIKKAALLLKQGKIIAFPTETVYGIGACLFNKKAIRKIFIIKKRPLSKPMSVHVAEDADIADIAEVSGNARKLIEKFWPGPLTLVLKKKKSIPSLVTAKLPNVAIRCPDNKIFQALVKEADCPIVASSANLTGKPPASTAKEVFKNFKTKIPLIIDGGKSKFGLASTVLDLTHRPTKVLRQGAISIDL